MDSDNALNYHQNAVAGPSKTAQDNFPVFLPPPAAHPPSRTYLASTQDLLARFNLHAAYDKHVRPLAPAPVPTQPPSATGLPSTPHAPLPDSDDKTKKNSYRFLVKNVPGKHSMKKDDYLTTMMQVPPKQRMPITEFDERTQREAFTVSADGLKGWNASALVLESAQAREDRRKRKELKKLARAQAQGLTPAVVPSAPNTFPPPQSAPPNQSQPSVQQPSGSSWAQPTHQKPYVPAVSIPPTTAAISTPTSAAPRSAVSSGSGPQRAGTPSLSTARGKKREFEDGALPPTSGTNAGNLPIGVIGVHAGSNGVRPRPVKKQKLDAQAHAREIPMQQPTPQGA